MEPILGQNRLEDVSWLCSLSESELDLLISLKKLVLQRARMVGHEELAEKFDLKMLRALGVALFLLFGGTLVAYRNPKSEWGWVSGRVFFWFAVWEGVTVPNPNCWTCAAFVLMECIKDKVKDLTLIPGSNNSAAFMESCNLLKCNLSDIMSLEEIKTCIGVDLRKEATKRFCNSITVNETTLNQKKQKFGSADYESGHCKGYKCAVVHNQGHSHLVIVCVKTETSIRYYCSTTQLTFSGAWLDELKPHHGSS